MGWDVAQWYSVCSAQTKLCVYRHHSTTLKRKRKRKRKRNKKEDEEEEDNLTYTGKILYVHGLI